MKLVEKAKYRKQNVKHKLIDKTKKEKVHIVAQEIKFARLLSGNETKTRERLVKTLKKWLNSCFQKGYDFKEEDFTRVWKGLFYAVWMSDKPLVQEELCESISGILDEFPVDKFKYAILMIKSGFKMLATEWFGIDQHRMDKFMMLVRRFLRGSLRCLKRSDWDLEHCQMYSNMLSNPDGILAVKVPHYARNATSMILHFIDCYLEELSKVSEGRIPEDSVVALLRPLVACVCGGAGAVCVRARRALTALLRQSELGLRYQEATAAWKRMGCPKGGPEALELVLDDENESEDHEDLDSSQESDDEDIWKALDPRAGRVDVELTPLPVPAQKMADALREQLRTASSKAHKRLKICMQRFERLAKQEYPLPLPQSDWDITSGPKVSSQKSAESLATLETKLTESADELALRGLSRKHRKRILARSRAGVNIVEELEKAQLKKQQKERKDSDTTNGGWQVEESEPKAKKPKLHDAKKPLTKGDLKKKQQPASTEVVASKKLKKKDKKDSPKKEKVTNSVEKIKGVTDIKKCKVNGKPSKTDIIKTDIIKTPKVSKPTETSEKDKTVNGISDKKVKNAPKVIKDAKKHGEGKQTKQLNVDAKKPKIKDTSTGSGDKVTQKNKAIEKPKINKVCLHKDVKGKDKISKDTKPSLLVNKVKNYQKSTKKDIDRMSLTTPKKVKFVLKNNSMQGAVDYYKSVRQSPNIPYNPSKQPSKTNLKISSPSPINPFFKKKLKLK